jgi:acetamidase/formamidase
VHYLSGPIAVNTAEPGDLLKVELLNLGPLEGDEWGFTVRVAASRCRSNARSTAVDGKAVL